MNKKLSAGVVFNINHIFKTIKNPCLSLAWRLIKQGFNIWYQRPDSNRHAFKGGGF